MATDRDSPVTEADPAGADEAPANPIRAAVAAAERFVPPEDDGAAGDDYPGGDDGPPPHDGPPEGEAEGGKRRRRPRQRDVVLEDFADVELWHDKTGEGCASLPVSDHVEHHPIRSREFKRWLSWRHYERHKEVLSAAALEDVSRICDARATAEGPLCTTFMRVGADEKGAIYLDRGGPAWDAIKITADRWEPIAKPPVKFLRSRSMLEVPPPVGGATSAVAALRPFVPGSDDVFVVVSAWLVSTMRPGRPYPVLVINGEQGSGKSLFSRMMRSLVDPSVASIRSMPKDETDLAVAAVNSHILCFDNISTFSAAQSDALCRLATGGSFGRRANYTDRDENLMEFTRPVALNGIGDVFGRPDLSDRALSVFLPAIEEKQRRTERAILAEFEAAQPEILGGLLDVVSVALRRLPEIKLDGAPRMADFVEWILAAAPAMEIEPAEFMQIYNDNRRGLADAAFVNDVFAVALHHYVTTYHPNGLEMEPQTLYAALNSSVDDETRRSGSWPKSAAGFGTRLRRVAPLLRARGLTVDTAHSGRRRISILPRREG